MFELFQIRDDFPDRIRVILFDRQRQQFPGVVESGRQVIEQSNDLLEPGTFLAERLRAFGYLPDVGLFELEPDLGQPFGLGIIVKDTSSTRSCVRRGRRSTV